MLSICDLFLMSSLLKRYAAIFTDMYMPSGIFESPSGFPFFLKKLFLFRNSWIGAGGAGADEGEAVQRAPVQDFCNECKLGQ